MRAERLAAALTVFGEAVDGSAPIAEAAAAATLKLQTGEAPLLPEAVALTARTFLNAKLAAREKAAAGTTTDSDTVSDGFSLLLIAARASCP